MSERRIVPLAYVTRWATTEGIRVVRDATVTEMGALSKGGFLYVPTSDWTEDKAAAESRYRAKIDAARQSAERKAKAMEHLYRSAPRYTEG